MWQDLLTSGAAIPAPLPLAEAEARLGAAATGLGADRVPLGRSREGRPLELVRIGAGDRRVLWYAGPHANEVVGVATVVALAERLAAHPDPLAGDTGVDLLLCVDPDAYVRNEPWFAAEIDPTAYYRHFHRPARDEWPDYDFPVAHRTLVREPRMPESAAMRAALERSGPALMVSLHNGELHGVHGYVRGEDPALAAALSTVPGRVGLPAEELPLDDPTAAPLAPGVFAYPRFEETWDAVLASPAPDPAALLPMGDSAASWAATRFGTATVLVEVPHWTLAEPPPAEGTVGDLLRRTGAALTAFRAGLAETLDAADLPDTDLRVRSCRDAVPMLAGLCGGFDLWAGSEVGARRATSGDVGRIGIMLGACLPQRYRGMLLGALLDAGAPAELVVAARREFDTGMAAIRSVPLRAVPFATMVEAQLAAGVLATDVQAVPA
jgi:hypothetical protein